MKKIITAIALLSCILTFAHKKTGHLKNDSKEIRKVTIIKGTKAECLNLVEKNKDKWKCVLVAQDTQVGEDGYLYIHYVLHCTLA